MMLSPLLAGFPFPSYIPFFIFRIWQVSFRKRSSSSSRWRRWWRRRVLFIPRYLRQTRPTKFSLRRMSVGIGSPSRSNNRPWRNFPSKEKETTTSFRCSIIPSQGSPAPLPPSPSTKTADFFFKNYSGNTRPSPTPKVRPLAKRRDPRLHLLSYEEGGE